MFDENSRFNSSISAWRQCSSSWPRIALAYVSGVPSGARLRDDTAAAATAVCLLRVTGGSGRVLHGRGFMGKETFGAILSLVGALKGGGWCGAGSGCCCGGSGTIDGLGALGTAKGTLCSGRIALASSSEAIVGWSMGSGVEQGDELGFCSKANDTRLAGAAIVWGQAGTASMVVVL